MSLEIPNKEQMIYAQMAIVHSLMDYIRDNIEDSEFDDKEIDEHLKKATIGLLYAFFRMKGILQNKECGCGCC